MKNKYVFTAVLLAVILFVGNMLTMVYVRTEQSREQLKEGNLLVVTSFYPMYVAAENVIGDVEGVTLENLSEPQTGCLHDYQLTAADMKLLSKADVFIVNGGGIESFLSDVAESYPNLKIIQACDGIELLQAAEGTEDVDSMKRNQKNTCMRRKQQIRRRKAMFMTKRPIMQITIILSIHMGMKMLMHG